MDTLLYILLVSFLVSMFSFSGAVLFLFSKNKLQNYLLYFVSFAAGSLLGGAFFHLIPEGFEIILETNKNILLGSFSILIGILIMYIIEKFLHWHHHHDLNCKTHIISKISLIGGSFHKLIDGFLIGISFLGSVKLGLTITILIIIHKIPQEIGNLAILLNGKFSRKKALRLNYVAGITTIIGAVLVYMFLANIKNSLGLFLLFTSGSFLYIALSDIIPELHSSKLNVFLLNISLLLGLFISYLLKFIN